MVPRGFSVFSVQAPDTCAPAPSGRGSAPCQPFPPLSGDTLSWLVSPPGHPEEATEGEPHGGPAHSAGFAPRPSAPSASSGKAILLVFWAPRPYPSCSLCSAHPSPLARLILPTSACRIFRREKHALCHCRSSNGLISTWRRRCGTLGRPRTSCSPACLLAHVYPAARRHCPRRSACLSPPPTPSRHAVPVPGSHSPR